MEMGNWLQLNFVLENMNIANQDLLGYILAACAAIPVFHCCDNLRRTACYYFENDRRYDNCYEACLEQCYLPVPVLVGACQHRVSMDDSIDWLFRALVVLAEEPELLVLSLHVGKNSCRACRAGFHDPVPGQLHVKKLYLKLK